MQQVTKDEEMFSLYDFLPLLSQIFIYFFTILLFFCIQQMLFAADIARLLYNRKYFSFVAHINGEQDFMLASKVRVKSVFFYFFLLRHFLFVP